MSAQALSTPGAPGIDRARLLLLPNAGRTPTQTIARRDAVFRRALFAADTLAVILATAITVTLIGGKRHAVVALAAIPVLIMLAKLTRTYDRQEALVRKSTLDETPALFQTATLYSLTVWLLCGVWTAGRGDRLWFLVDWPMLSVLLISLRVVARSLSRRITPVERCLVIGDGPTCGRVRSKLAGTPVLHARVVMQVPIDGLGDDDLSLNALTTKDDLEALTSDYRIDRIIVAPELADADDVLNVIRAATSVGVKVSVVPRLLEVIGSSVEFDDVEGIPLLSMRSVRLSRSSWMVKRVLDVIVSVTALVLLAPLLAFIALIIRLDSEGPVFFRQRRVGRNGEAFEMVKFRTMVDGAHAQREALAHLNESVGLFKIEEDPRITRVGAFLRKTSLDELPQLLNVLRGEMSLVGPRPLVLEEDRRIEGWHRRRLQLTPGMTGPWQIMGSARIPLHEMVNIDYLYVTNWSLWNDLKILMRTVHYVAARRGM